MLGLKCSEILFKEEELPLALMSDELRQCDRGLSLHRSRYSMVFERRIRVAVCLSVCLSGLIVVIVLERCVLLVKLADGVFDVVDGVVVVVVDEHPHVFTLISASFLLFSVFSTTIGVCWSGVGFSLSVLGIRFSALGVRFLVLGIWFLVVVESVFGIRRAHCCGRRPKSANELDRL